MPLRKLNPTLRTTRLSSQSKGHALAVFSAPLKGLDTSRPLVLQDKLTGLTLDNCWVRRHGNELRGGAKRWKTNIGGVGTEAEIRTIMPYTPNSGSSKLFGAGSDGKIYDITTQTSEATTPSSAVTVASQTVPGEFSYINYTVGGVTYLCCCSAGGGYWTYDTSGGWVDRTASITGAGAAAADEFCYVIQWKRRLIFLRASTTEAYYLPVDVITGAGALFDFGPTFRHAGEAAALASYTLDSGAGIDDKLVIFSSEGDIVVYAGTDPAAADTFALQGVWHAGKVPRGRRFVSKHGGDVIMLTDAGMQSISEIISGQSNVDPTVKRDTPGFRYNQTLGASIAATYTSKYWSVLEFPQERAVVLLTPYNTSSESVQYVYSTDSMAWSTFSDLQMVSADVYEGELYYGTLDGKIMQAFTGNSDDELSTGVAGSDLTATVQTAFVMPDKSPSIRRMLQAMPMFQGPSAPAVTASINTEWNVNNSAGAPSYIASGAVVWDTAIWDQSVWGGATNTYAAWVGVTGAGVYASLGLIFKGQPGLVFTSWKLLYEDGGYF